MVTLWLGATSASPRRHLGANGKTNVIPSLVPMQRRSQIARRHLWITSPSVASNNVKKQFQIQGLAHFFGIFLEAPNWNKKYEKRSHAEWRSFSFSPERSHAAWHSFFSFWGYRWTVQHGLNEGVKHMYKTNAVLHIFRITGTTGAVTKSMPKNTKCKTRFEHECLVRSPWVLFGVHLS